MTLPDPIGAVHYGEPRGVIARDPNADGGKHSAVSSQFLVYTDTLTQAQELIKRWPEVMQAADDKAQEILASVQEPQPEETNA